MQDSRIKFNRSTGSDTSWGTPSDLPVQGEDTHEDDISAVVAWDGKIGIMWSNQTSGIKSMFFAYHNDGDGDFSWSARETALVGSGSYADDHINFSVFNSEIYVAIKSSLQQPTQTITFLVKRSSSGNWSNYHVTEVQYQWTRPVMYIDEDNEEVYVAAASDYNPNDPQGDNSDDTFIYIKKADLNNPVFPPGVGDTLLMSTTDLKINNPTTTRQNLTKDTGFLMLASDKTTEFYVHDYFDVNAAPLPKAFFPVEGPVGTTINITGLLMGGVTSVSFNGTAATSFTVVNDTLVQADVPAGASTGVITLTNSDGSGSTSNNFEVTVPPFDVNVTVNGNGTVNLDPPGGSYGQVTNVTLTAVPAAGFAFNGWSGDVSGMDNPLTTTIYDDINVTAEFVDVFSTLVPTAEETETGNSAASVFVSTSGPMDKVVDALYLATISTRKEAPVAFVQGLGLTWTKVKEQCAGRNQGTLEVWMAQGAPSGDGIVTAALATIPDYSVIAVTRYSQVDLDDPIGAVLSANSNGFDGACSGGEDSLGYAFDLTTTTDRSTVFAAAALRNQTHNPGVGFTERAEMSQVGIGGNSAGTAVQDQFVMNASTISVNAGFSSNTDWAAIGIEILAGTAGTAAPIRNVSVTAVGNGTVTVDPPGPTYDDGTVLTITATPDPFYRLENWSGGLSGNQNPATYTVSDDDSIFANFSNFPDVTVSVSAIGSGNVTLNPPGGVYTPGDTISLTAVPDSGWVFDFWGDGLISVNNPETYVVPTGDTTITANFSQLPQVTLTATAIGNGTLQLNPPGGIYYVGTTVTVTALPDSGNVFAIWTGAINGVLNPQSVVMDVNKNVTAIFTELPKYKITLTNIGNGNIVANPPSPDSTYFVGTTVTLTATPDSANIFQLWGGDLSGTVNPQTFSVVGNQNVTATFNRQYAIDLTTIGNGMVTLDPPGPIYLSGTTVTATAVPDTGNTFLGWNGALTGTTNPSLIFFDSDKSVTANFTSKFGLTVTEVGSGTVTINPPGSFFDDTTNVTLTAVPDSGFRLSSWSGDLTGTTSPSTILMDTTRDVTATFTQQFRLDLSQTGLGTVTLNPLPVVADSAGGLYDIGTVVTVTATPDSGSVFTSYSGDLIGGTAVQQLTMDADKTVDALFTRRYLLSLTQLGSGTVTLSPPPVAGTVNAAFYDAGTVVTVTSTPDSGSIFFGYNGDLTGTEFFTNANNGC